ncbi:hypothetical protein PC116_g28688 [Phytophthora cactorum]|uniref:Uncharacterized protein n=1 Tax=Phytophthora cactorum TaxID=29920 RepID=A0A8T1BPN0_9STRA|nr:hypothetical protein PC114_g20863 [Phytophthora cactorum]KAG2906343.1 hypothetical protein PC117_g20547 [Phytophthora cactorum]KAG2973205.1 hypothetical protein PC120_g26183 [Phytophthora cactorum]KAG2984974.1 hypothetical protein PC119_g20260 [Phytophthora cactorum]KAG3123044.1 hypothetical protein C6341_g26721 [Phytophthora cactorum]
MVLKQIGAAAEGRSTAGPAGRWHGHDRVVRWDALRGVLQPGACRYAPSRYAMMLYFVAWLMLAQQRQQSSRR